MAFGATDNNMVTRRGDGSGGTKAGKSNLLSPHSLLGQNWAHACQKLMAGIGMAHTIQSKHNQHSCKFHSYVGWME